MKFAFDINMTEACTLRCKYCIENFNKSKFNNLSEENIKKIKSKFDYLLKDRNFLKEYDGISIYFWGGEPTTNPNGIKDFVNYYKNDERVDFYIYSNGYKLDHLYDFLEENNERVTIQISYDGLASHNVDRVSINGKGSALKVKETIYDLNKRNINFIIHPTIAIKNFDKISENYFEFRRMNETLKIDLTYSPTIDYLTDIDPNLDLEEVKNILKSEFKKIAKSEIDYFKQNGHFFLSWFNEEKLFCGAGKHLQAIELDGTIYPCHGVMNGKSKEKLILNNLNLENKKFTKNLLSTSKLFKSTSNNIPNKCKNCYSTYCMKCNSKKYDESKLSGLTNKWTDYSNQPHLCEFFKFFTKFRFALLSQINN